MGFCREIRVWGGLIRAFLRGRIKRATAMSAGREA